MIQEYLVIYEQRAVNWGGFCPDMPGCQSVGESFEHNQQTMREAVRLYVDDVVTNGGAIPERPPHMIDFSTFGSNYRDRRFHIEWVGVSLPEITAATTATQAA